MKLPTKVSTSDMHINALIYGNEGVGKTTFAATAQDHPDMAPVLFVNFEGGMLSVASRGDIQQVRIESIKELEEVFWALQKGEEPFDQFNTVVIDSATDMAKLSLQEATFRGLQNPKRTGTLDELQLQDYGQMTTQMSRLFRWFRNLQKHVIITALQKSVTNQQTGEVTEIRPDLTNRLGDSIMGFVDFVWCMTATEEGRYILTQKNGLYRAKTRGLKFSEALGLTVENPTLPDLWETLQQTEGVTEKEIAHVE